MADEPAQSPKGAQKQKTTGPNSPVVNQGPGSIAQFGNNNQATIHNAPPPWVLNAVQGQAIADVVRRHPTLWDGKSDAIICLAGDSESMQMAEAFVAAIRAGGWNLPHGGYAQGWYSSIPLGIEVVVPETPPSEELMSFLRDFSAALNRAGLVNGPLGVQQTQQMTQGQFQIRIGRRP